MVGDSTARLMVKQLRRYCIERNCGECIFHFDDGCNFCGALPVSWETDIERLEREALEDETI